MATSSEVVSATKGESKKPGSSRPRWRPEAFALVAFTGALVIVGMLQYGTLRSQTEVQRLISQPNIAPAYGGKRDDGLIVALSNTGALPALEVVVASRADFRKPLSGEDLLAFCTEVDEPTPGITVHPGATIEHHVAYPDFSLKDPAANELYYVCGSVTYTDAFRGRRESAYCFSFSRRQIDTANDHSICSLPERLAE